MVGGEVAEEDVGVAELNTALDDAGVTLARPLGRGEPLSAVGLAGVDLLACVCALEARYGIEYPGDLVAALETVDDLVHYTNVKRSQR